MGATGTSSAGRRQPPIADFGFLSDCHTAVLIDRRGSIDWWCVPRFDSPSVFGRLLDPDAAHWTIRPEGDFDVEREYTRESLVLWSVFRTARGEVRLTDAAALHPGARGHALGIQAPHAVLRRVEGVRGTVAMEIDFSPCFEYGRTEPHVREVPEGVVDAAVPRS